MRFSLNTIKTKFKDFYHNYKMIFINFKILIKITKLFNQNSFNNNKSKINQ